MESAFTDNKQSNIDSIPVTVQILVGERKMTIAELKSKIAVGSIIELDAAVEDNFKLMANDKVIAEGTVEQVDRTFQMVISKVVS
ncbi:FliM/FliN family flagellar motor switch protein [Vibrio vulnificus]|nr:FliM/FliN family flagellar motor switch protein [Vibrio vulnificus]